MTVYRIVIVTRGGAKIKIRGNTSAYNDKKSYKIKFTNKVDLIQDGSVCKSKEWILLRTYGSLKTAIGFETNRMLGMRYTPQYQYVNLVINNNYRGLYILTESLEKNKGKVDISEDGYIIEADAYYWNEEHFFKTNLLDEHFGYTFKYPSSKKIDDDCVNYIKDYMLKFESSIPVGNYDKYIDVDSWALWLLVHDILGSKDAGGANIYLSKQDRSDSTKLQMPTTWDFDAIFMSDSCWASVHDNWFYFHLLYNSVNPSFKKNYCDTYKRLSSDFFHKMDVFLTSIESSRMGMALDNSRQLDSKRWDYQYKPIKEEITEIRLWFSERRKWMDVEMSSMEKQ